MTGLLFGVFLISLPTSVFNEKQFQNFGPYNYEFKQLGICKGPKQSDCGSVRMDSIRNLSNIPFILDFPQDCPVTKARVTIGTQNNNKNKTLWNYQLNKPCQHFVLGPLLIKSFNLTHNCLIKKGHYRIDINMDELTRNFFGSNFFYDTYFFKNIAHNNVNNFFCVHSVLRVFKAE